MRKAILLLGAALIAGPVLAAPAGGPRTMGDADGNGVLFPRDWLKRQDLSILAEHGIGHLDLTACSRFLLIEDAHHFGLQDVATRHDQV